MTQKVTDTKRQKKSAGTYSVKVKKCRYWFLDKKKLPVLIPLHKNASNNFLTKKKLLMRDRRKVPVLTLWK